MRPWDVGNFEDLSRLVVAPLRRQRNEPRCAPLIHAIRVALRSKRLILRRWSARNAEDARDDQ